MSARIVANLETLMKQGDKVIAVIETADGELVLVTERARIIALKLKGG